MLFSADKRYPEAMPKEAVLANSVGTYLETAPIAALRCSFRCAWINRLPDEEVGTVAVVPDGCIDLIWRGERLSVVGPDLTAARPVLQRGDTVLGLRFEPGAAASWLGLSIAEIVGKEIELQDVWGQKAHRIAESMEEAGDAQQRLVRLQKHLAGTAPSIDGVSKHGRAIFGFLQKNATRQSDRGIRQLAVALGTSERSLRRQTHEIFGYGPKTLHRILRLQASITSVRRSNAPQLADIAYENGYTDQAHLNREIQSLCGMTAGEFVRQLAR
ncbi:helix-turn-helix domain-containing protein [Chelativorans sp. YIM 93263]|uniref:helix-turn-helix domain-containing protein n=1 Tax=Chelativorans sp. YIM 93263 TaxID=2906648 RepID=UPI0030834123